METPFFTVDSQLREVADRAMARLTEPFARIEQNAVYNQQKVLAAFIHNQVSESCFAATTGYGYGDRGHEVLDATFAEIMGAEDALVRHFLLSGTHAISVALFGLLRAGDTLLAATGAPYDTLETVVGKSGAEGSLMDLGVNYTEVALNERREPDIPAIQEALRADSRVRLVHIQRSRGYDTRESFSVETIGRVIAAVKAVRPEVPVFVDNCYGEFVERLEPTQVGADIMAGSLIKNPGGGIAENGGYICGRRDLVERCATRMTTPGLGREIGASLGHNRTLFMGLFQAPHVVGEALKTAAFCAALFEELGYEVSPSAEAVRTDIVQIVKLKNAERLIAFCRGIQSASPVDAFATPEPAPMPGYDSEVIMAAGAFTMGSSIELSADAPLREPFAVYMQGGLNFASGQIGILSGAQSMLEAGVLKP